MNRLVSIYFFVLFNLAPSFGQTIDLRLLKPLHAGHYPTWDRTMNGVSWSVYPVILIEPLSVWSVGYFKHDKIRMRNGYKSAISIATANLISLGLKYAIQRKRPYVSYPTIIEKRSEQGPYSFPSGHTTAAFSAATALTLSTKKWWVGVPAYTYASLVGYARMRLGAHYPSDVLGGACIGVLTGLLTWKIDQYILKK